MKKLRLLFVLPFVLIIVNSAGAQVRFGIFGGCNLANLSSPELDSLGVGFSNSQGLVFGGALDFGLSKNFGISLEPMFIQKGAEQKFRDRRYGDFKKITNLSYFEVPLLLRISSGTDGIVPYIMGGPYLAYLLDAKEKIEGEFIRPGFENDYDIKDRINTIEYGVRGIVGLRIPFFGKSSFFIEGGYEQGLSNINAVEGASEVKTKGLQVMGGIKFAFGQRKKTDIEDAFPISITGEEPREEPFSPEVSLIFPDKDIIVPVGIDSILFVVQTDLIPVFIGFRVNNRDTIEALVDQPVKQILLPVDAGNNKIEVFHQLGPTDSLAYVGNNPWNRVDPWEPQNGNEGEIGICPHCGREKGWRAGLEDMKDVAGITVAAGPIAGFVIWGRCMVKRHTWDPFCRCDEDEINRQQLQQLRAYRDKIQNYTKSIAWADYYIHEYSDCDYDYVGWRWTWNTSPLDPATFTPNPQNLFPDDNLTPQEAVDILRRWKRSWENELEQLRGEFEAAGGEERLKELEEQYGE